jgi:hypothetical protein
MLSFGTAFGTALQVGQNDRNPSAISVLRIEFARLTLRKKEPKPDAFKSVAPAIYPLMSRYHCEELVYARLSSPRQHEKYIVQFGRLQGTEVQNPCPCPRLGRALRRTRLRFCVTGLDCGSRTTQPDE